jgi:hypothetical protein
MAQRPVPGDRDVPDLPGDAVRPGHHRAVDDQPAADPRAERDQGERGRADAVAEPALGDRDRFDVVVDGRFQSGGLGDRFGQRDIPPVQERGVPDMPGVAVDVSGDRHPEAVRALPICR